jgi:SprT protein
MPKTKVDFTALNNYLPDNCFNDIMHFVRTYNIQLTITRSRKSVLGDYRHAYKEQGHRISVNGDLNKYAFLITLLHEIAHLITFEKFGRKVQPHGQEWKQSFKEVLQIFLANNIFPEDIKTTLLHSIKNLAASSCGDEKLLRVLKNYDATKDAHVFVESLPVGSLFSINQNRIFKKGEQLRKRFKCQEIQTGKWYLFSPVFEVTKINS